MQERLAALRKLAETAPFDRASSFAQALSAAKDPAREVRAAAAEALAATGEPDEALRALGVLASDDDVGVRLEATAALCGLPWRGRLDLLAKRLDDEDLGVVAMAADGLAHARDPRAIPALEELLRERRLRFQAMEGLFTLRARSFTLMARKLFGSFLTPSFEKTLAALELAREGDAKALDFLRKRVQKRTAEERPLIVVHAVTIDPGTRSLIEQLAGAQDDYLRESALLALTKVDAGWWARAQESIARWADEDPHVSAEVLLGLFEIDWQRASLLADAHAQRENELGAAARRVRLASALRAAFPGEILLRCD